MANSQQKKMRKIYSIESCVGVSGGRRETSAGLGERTA